MCDKPSPYFRRYAKWMAKNHADDIPPLLHFSKNDNSDPSLWAWCDKHKQSSKTCECPDGTLYVWGNRTIGHPARYWVDSRTWSNDTRDDREVWFRAEVCNSKLCREWTSHSDLPEHHRSAYVQMFHYWCTKGEQKAQAVRDAVILKALSLKKAEERRQFNLAKLKLSSQTRQFFSAMAMMGAGK